MRSMTASCATAPDRGSNVAADAPSNTTNHACRIIPRSNRRDRLVSRPHRCNLTFTVPPSLADGIVRQDLDGRQPAVAATWRRLAAAVDKSEQFETSRLMASRLNY